jgi:hypothetical protein
MTCGGERSNSDAIAMKRRLERWMSWNISAHASAAGELRGVVLAPIAPPMVLICING